MVDDRQAWRSDLGSGAALWSSSGHHQVTEGRWVALSGARSVEYNVVCCHGDEGPEAVADSLGLITEAGVPSLLMLAGPALGDAQPLVDAGWVIVGTTPFLVNPSLAGTADPAVRPIDPGPPAGSTVGLMAGMRDVVTDAFALDPLLGDVVIPDDPGAVIEGARIWGLWEDGDLRSCVLVAPVRGSVVIWWMATPPDRQRRGYGRRLLSAVLGDAARRGHARSVLLASPAGLGLYRALGYELVEHWQIWSRRRWVLGRA